MLRLPMQQPLQLRFTFQLREVGKLDDAKIGDTGRLDDLHRTAVDQVVARPQDLVPRYEAVERTLQSACVDRTFEPEGCGRVVGNTLPFELAEQPEELLGVRERCRR